MKVNEQMVFFLIMKKEFLVTCVLHDKSILFGVLQTIQIDRLLCLCKSVKLFRIVLPLFISITFNWDFVQLIVDKKIFF